MKNLILALALLSVPFTAVAQLETDSTGAEAQSVLVEGKTVAVSAKGLDVRSVLFDLFSQTGNNFIIDDGVRHVLYLNLAEVGFEQALHVILKQADLGYEVKENIFYIGRNRSKAYLTPPKAVEAKLPETKLPDVKGAETKPPTPVVEPPKLPLPGQSSAGSGAGSVGKVGTITQNDLTRARLTTRMAMADIRDVFREFTKQTGFEIEVAEDVPKYKIDAFLLDTSLKYALDVVTDATKLKYTLTDRYTIRIEKG